MAYPKDPRATTKWQALEERASAAEQAARYHDQEARRWQASGRKARAELAALGKQHEALARLQARDIKKAVRAAIGELLLEMGKLESTLYDTRQAVLQKARESSWRLRAQPELARMRRELLDKDALIAAQSSRLQQLESRTEHSKQSIASLVVAAAAAEHERAAAVKEWAAIEAAAVDAEAEAAERELALSTALSQVQAQLKASQVEVNKVAARLELQVQQRLLVVDLPKVRNWDVSAGSAAVYRSKEVQALVELLESRQWRPEDISAALASACFKDTAEPISLQVFDQKEF